MKRARSILITAGPTIEPIDPVRFISNRSTGYMGYELAKAARKRRYKVTLISGPTGIKPPSGIRFFRVETTLELHEKIKEKLGEADVLIMASAVSDFKALSFSSEKIKSKKHLTLKFAKNPDILKSITKKMRKNRIIVGFSLETTGLLKNSLQKLQSKKLDLIIANKAGGENKPFGKGKKTVFILDRHGCRKSLTGATKPQIARAILDTVEELCYTPN